MFCFLLFLNFALFDDPDEGCEPKFVGRTIKFRILRVLLEILAFLFSQVVRCRCLGFPGYWYTDTLVGGTTVWVLLQLKAEKQAKFSVSLRAPQMDDKPLWQHKMSRNENQERISIVKPLTSIWCYWKAAVNTFTITKETLNSPNNILMTQWHTLGTILVCCFGSADALTIGYLNSHSPNFLPPQMSERSVRTAAL